jgi:hypothetical protein
MKEISREQQLREMREANYARKRKGPVIRSPRKEPNPFEDAARGRDPAPKNTRKATGAIVTEDARKTGSGNPSGTSGKPSKGTPIDKGPRVNSGAKRGRPPKPDGAPISRATLYRRRQKEQKK